MLESAAHLLERWMWEEERVVSAKVAQRVDSEDRGKDGAKVRTKEKVKVGLQTQRKEAAWAKVWVVKVTKGLAGHVARWVTRRERASVEARVVPKGPFRKWENGRENR